MVDLRGWLGLGTNEDEDEDAVSKTLNYLGSFGTTASDAVGTAATALGDTVSSAASALSDAYADVVPAGAMFAPRQGPTEERRPQYSGPGYAQPRLEPGQPSMLEQMPEIGAAGLSRAAETLGDRGALLSGLRRPGTALEVAEQAAPAPARAVQLASEVGRSFGGGALRRFGEGTAPPGEDVNTPPFTTPRIGPIPSYPVTRGDVGEAVGSVLGDPTTYLGFGAAGRAADLPVQAALGAVGRSLRGGAGLVRRAAGGIADGMPAPGAVDEGVQMLGSGVVPQGGDISGLWQQAKGALDGLVSRLSAADEAVEAAERSGDTAAIDAADAAYGHIRREHDAAADAVEALRPAVRRREGALEAAGLGRNAEEAGLADAGAAAPGDTRVRGAVSPFPDTSPRDISLNAGMEAQPGTGLRSAAYNAAQGGVFGAASESLEAGAEDREADPAEMARRALIGGALGVGAGMTARRGGGTRLGGGMVPGGGRPLPPGAGGGLANLPGVQQALSAAQQRAARMAANPTGAQPLGPLAWLGELAKSVGYSSMIGVRTATTNVLGNLGEPVWAGPKEGARALTPRALGGRGQPGEAAAWATGNVKGALRIPSEVKDALLARGSYASNPDQATLSARTVNPVGHLIALLPELGGRVFSGLPDAIFGSLARGAGEEMTIARTANDAGWTGPARQANLQQLVADVADLKAGNTIADPAREATARAVLEGGQSYANDMTYRNPLGTVSKKLESAARLGNTPVLGTMTTPFFTTPQNMNLRMLERTPVGFGMNTANRPGTLRTNFDRVYDATVGTAILSGLVYGYAGRGKITGSGPSDPEQRKMLEKTGWRPYSSLVTAPDGRQYYIPNKNIGNYGPLLNLVGELHDGYVFARPNADGREITFDAAKRFGRLVQDSPYASGLADLVHALDDPASGALAYGASLGARLTPYAGVARDIATASDPYERAPETGKDVGIWDELVGRYKAQTGRRGDLEVKRDVSGQPVTNEQQGWKAFLPKATPYEGDPLITELLGKHVDLSAPRDHFTVTAAGADAPDGGVGTRQIKLTPEEQAAWQQHRWDALQEVFPMVSDPEFQRQPESIKQRIWRANVASAGRRADGMVRADIGEAWDARVRAAPVVQ